MGKEVTGHWKKLVSDPKYLGEADFAEGQEIAVTIASITEDTVVNTDGKANKIIVHFKENCKPLVLNVTNSKAIVKVTGKKKVEEWKGHRILLYVDPRVRAFGEVVAAVRVRPYPPKETSYKPTGEPVKCQMCEGDIKPYGKKSTAEMADYTLKTYGKKLCADCATQVAAKLKEEGGDNQVK